MTSVFQLFFFFFLLITLRRKHQICVWLGKWELGGFQLQCDCSPSAVPPYWRGYDGVRAGAAGQCSGTAETASSRGRSWNTTPRLLTLLLSVSHIFSPLLLTLPLFYLRFWSFLTLHHHHLASIPPDPPSLSVVSPPIEFLPHLSSSSSGALQRGYGLIWISECISTSSSLGHGVVLRPHSCGGVMGPSAQGSLS